jgi:hypothetical protein
MKANTQTPMIKSTFSNKVHKLLNPNPVKNRDKWRVKPEKLTDQQKIELFDKIVEMDKECSQLLGSYWYNRREKKRVLKKRQENLEESLAE